ncbi:hypothetical protein MTP99_015852 [Tenebrio molitor]|jgi:hypothetical protein|uniref:DNA damage-regulated autophagy modulator protein 2-like n=1 Tax=Tenebrio molitor TaxID=7067 RepID=UPI00270FCDBA|nr:hypothetical protein MTP99_015852 [Tenebrio molitor]
MDLKFRLHFLPIFTALWLLCTFIISYLVAVFNNHVYEFFPYISDTGAYPPESCIFGEMLNIAAVFMLITMYVRYKVVELIDHKNIKKCKTLNNWSTLFGALSCLGISLVANFQETSEINVHFVGAFLAFGVGAIYCLIQAYLTWLSYSSKALKCLRILLSGLLIPFYIITTACSMLSFNKFDGNSQFKWNYKNSGYELHLVATFAEWIMAILMTLYIGSYYVEFRLIKFREISFITTE